MKKLSILLFAIMMVGSLNAQIEEVSAEQDAPKTEVKKKGLPTNPYPANLMEGPYDLIGQKLYCVHDYIENCHTQTPIASVVIYPDSTIGLEKIKKGAYYTVTDVIYSKEQLQTLQTRLIQSKNYRKVPYIYIKNGKEKVYSLVKSRKEDIPVFLGNEGCLYVLSDDAGVLYFVAWRSAKYHNIEYATRYGVPVETACPILYSPLIGDFISVNTYNYLKEKYTNKELVYCEYYDPSCQRYYSQEEYAKEEIKKKYILQIEKVGVEKNRIVFVVNRNGYKETYEYEKEGLCIISSHKDTIPGVSFGSSNNLPFRMDIDSLLNKWHQEEQIKEAQARAEKAKQKAEYIKKYGAKYAQYIIDGKVCVGMTKEMCQEAKGRPNNTTRNSTSLGKVEVWTYSAWYPLVPITVVTFLDNKVTSVDEYKDNYPF